MIQKNKAALFWVPLSDCQCVCDKMHPEKKQNKTGTSPILIIKFVVQNSRIYRPEKNTPIMNVAVHYVATCSI